MFKQDIVYKISAIILLLLMFSGCAEIKLRLITTDSPRNLFFENAIAANPENAHAYFENGRTYLKEKNFSKAVKNFKKAVAIKPDFAEAWVGLGNAQFASEKTGKAFSAYSKSSEIDSNYADAKIGLAKCYIKNKNDQKAEELLITVTDRNSGNYESYRLLGDINYRALKYEKAAEYWRKSLDKNPADEELKNMLYSIEQFNLVYQSK